ncbi:MAG: transcriptional regulator [Crocosphaera sp.]
MTKTTNALDIIDNLIDGDPEMLEMIAEASLNAEIAQLIYEARMKANLTHQQLAELIKTEESVIVDLEEADYEGNALIMLQKIALLSHSP